MLDHDDDRGSVGLILNRPTDQKIGSLPHMPPNLVEQFSNSTIYFGGPVDMDRMTSLHNIPGVPGSEEICPGIYAGGFENLADVVSKGGHEESHVRFEHGHAAWGKGQLAKEIKANSWYLASASPDLVTGPCLRLPVPLWVQILDLMGDGHKQVSLLPTDN
ncbi:unnamed protein product [Chrysoparadoxa australica]